MSTSNASPALWTLGIAALALSGFSLWSSMGRSDGPRNEDVQEVDAASQADSLAKIEESQGLMLARLESLQRRVQGLESRGRQQVQVSEAANTKKGAMDSALPEGPSKAAAPKAEHMDSKEFATLLQKMFRQGGGASEEEKATFWKLARTTTMIDDQIKDLRAQVQANPGDTEKRLELADAYVAKLLTVPNGPERGIYGVKAEAQWKNILKKDPSNWQSQVSLGFSHSQYPDFMNMTGEAIQDFEKAIKIQERLPNDKRYAVTYSQLGLLYRKQGKIDKALALLREGNRRYPKDKSILKLLDELRSR